MARIVLSAGVLKTVPSHDHYESPPWEVVPLGSKVDCGDLREDHETCPH